MNATSPYENITPESLKAEILADITAQDADVSTREGSFANTLVSGAAYQIYQTYQRMNEALIAAFPDETSGAYIDKAAAQIGMSRIPGTKAEVTVSFAGADGTVIPAGTVLYASGSGLRFVTVAHAVISDGAAQADAQAAEEGVRYNLKAGEINSMYVNVAGVDSVTNPQAALGGTDEESDADFYARYHAMKTRPVSSGNKNQYILWALETPGVAYAQCIPVWNGAGTVKVVIAGSDRGAVGDDVVAACREHIKAELFAGVELTVVSVETRMLTLEAEVTLAAGYTAEQVAEQWEQLVCELLDEQPFGEAAIIPYSKFLGRLLQCDGVDDYSAMTVDGGTQAVPIGAEEAAAVASVAVSA